MATMTTWTRFAGAFLVSLAVAVPQVEAQTRARSAGSRSGSESGGGTAAPRSAPSSPAPSTSSAPPSSSRGTSSTSSVVIRGAAPAGQRIAQPRGAFSRPQTITRFGYRTYTPWYFGGTAGLYDSWRYRYGSALWGYPYYYGYYPVYGYYYPGYAYGSYGYGGSRSRRDYADDDQDARPAGSIRLRANPRHARVYVDGALVGTVDDFDGLSGHLKLDAGPHQLELRADGYETFTTDILVAADRTRTERVTLKRRP